MANKNSDFSKLDNQIESILKKNLDSISPSDDLIARTLLRLEQEKTQTGTKVTSITKKKKRAIPIALISSIAAGIIAVTGAVVLLTANSTKKSESATALEAPAKVDSFAATNDSPAIADNAIFADECAEEVYSVGYTQITISYSTSDVNIKYATGESLLDTAITNADSNDSGMSAFQYLSKYAMNSYSTLFFIPPLTNTQHELNCALYSSLTSRLFGEGKVCNTIDLSLISGGDFSPQKSPEKLAKMIPAHDILCDN